MCDRKAYPMSTKAELVIKQLRYFHDFPIKGINFLDILGIFENPDALQASIDLLLERIKQKGWRPDVIVGIDARGFLFAVPLALALKCPFMPIRKKGKLPGDVVSIESVKEYGSDTLEIQNSEKLKGAKVLIVDDILATGGTAKATVDLLRMTGADVLGLLFLTIIPCLSGEDKLDVDYCIAFTPPPS